MSAFLKKYYPVIDKLERQVERRKGMGDAFVYMFVIGSGTTSGVALVGFICYKLFMFMRRRETARAAGKNRKRRGIV